MWEFMVNLCQAGASGADGGIIEDIQQASGTNGEAPQKTCGSRLFIYI